MGSSNSALSSTSEAQLEVQNGEVEVRWYLSSFAPPYVKVLFSSLSLCSVNSFILVYSFYYRSPGNMLFYFFCSLFPIPLNLLHLSVELNSHLLSSDSLW